MSILEAFAFSKPVIASNLGGNSELVTDNFTGMLYEAGNIDDLRDKIWNLYNNDALRLKMSENCERIVKLNNRELFYEKLMRIYDKVRQH